MGVDGGRLVLTELSTVWSIAPVAGATRRGGCVGCVLEDPTSGRFAELDQYYLAPLASAVRLQERTITKRQVFLFKRVGGLATT